MPKRKSLLTTVTVLILFSVIVVYSSKRASNLEPINPKDVRLVNRVGGLPLSRWKVLFAQKDDITINKIVGLINSSSKTNFNERAYDWGKAIGYPTGIEIELKNNVKLRITKLFKVSSWTLGNGGRGSTAIPYKDRVKLDIENGKKGSSYTLFSEQLADYVLKGADQDMPHVNAFSIIPDTIKPGQTVTISGDGSTEDYIEVYITDGNSASNEKYLIDKVQTNYGAWKWEGTVNGRSIRTLDGKDIKLIKDRYFFQTTVAGGGIIDLSDSK
jgi:hypothetical protein